MQTTINSKNAPAAIGPYVQAIDLGNMVIISGQLPINPKTGDFPLDIQEQTRRSLENISSILIEAGLGIKDIVKTTVFVKNLSQFSLINETYQQFFDEFAEGKYPARSCVEIARLPKDAGIEIEAIAVRE